MLLYKSGSIIQVLEGDEPAVRQLYANIQRDPRHKHVTLLYTQTLETREFPEWTMGFNCVEVDWTPQHPEGFNPIFHRTGSAPTTGGRGTNLLRTFVETVR